MNSVAQLLFIASIVAVAHGDCIAPDGTTHASGEEWTKRGSMTGAYEFVIRCTGLRTEVVACVVPGSGERLTAGQTTTHDSREWRCETGADNTLTMRMRPTAFMRGATMTTKDQESMPTTRFETGSTDVEQSSTNSNRSATYTTQCKDSNGQSHQSGEEWVERGSTTQKYNFVMRCVGDQPAGTDAGTGGWRVEMIGCIVPTTGERLTFGQTTTTSDNNQWTCGGGEGMTTMNMQSLLRGPSAPMASKKGGQMTEGSFQ